MGSLLATFLIGSSPFVVFPYYYAVQQLQSQRRFSLDRYIFIAPIYLGLLNTLGFLISSRLGIAPLWRYLGTALIGASIVAYVIKYHRFYNYRDRSQWNSHYRGLYALYVVTFMAIVPLLERWLFL